MSEQDGLSVKKDADFSEWYSQVVFKAGLCDLRYGVKGFLVHDWWSVELMNHMFSFYEAVLRSNGHKQLMFPTVIPESYLNKEQEHVRGFSAEVFWVTEGGSDKKSFSERLALRPTSETAMYPMYALWIRSHNDLPFKRYQRCQVFRYESKMTRPFLRGREFYWIESHDAFASRDGAEAQVREDMDMTEDVMHQVFGIPFLFFRRPEWDKFAGAEYTFAADSIMPTGKALQQPSTHLLGQKFSRPFNILFKDDTGNDCFVWQTCYGPCIWRMVGSIVGLHGDDKGLILPPLISPYQIVVVPIFKKGSEKLILKECDKLVKKLKDFRVFADVRRGYSPGWKFNEWELRGVPLRIEVGPRDIKNKQAVLVRRDTGRSSIVKTGLLVSTANTVLEDIQKCLVNKADKYFSSMLFKADSLNNLKDIISGSGGFVRVPFCSVDKPGEKCADKVKGVTGGAEVRGVLYSDKSKPRNEKCIVCGKPANYFVYVAKSY